MTGVTKITPESVTVSGFVDTGGGPGVPFTLAGGGTLSWGNDVSIVNSTTSTEAMSIDGIPQNDSDSTTMIPGGDPSSVGNGGADDYSEVSFQYDTLKDYTAAGDSPGPNTQYANVVDVPTVSGSAPASTTLGAFGVSAQNNTGNTPLNPNTKYVYWIADQAGATDAAQSVNVFNPTATNAASSKNPNYECLPNSYIAANSYLSTLTTTGTVSGGVSSTTTDAAQTTPQPAIEGPCVYVYGNTNGNGVYTSPTGEFTTAALGKLSIGSVANVAGSKASVSISDMSKFKASGTLELDDSNGNDLASGTFALAAGKSGTVKLKLTSAGVKASKKHRSGVVTLTSNWGQPTGTKKIELLAPVLKKAKKSK